MTQYNDSAKNVKFFAELSGMPASVVKAIIQCEGQATPNPTNPFNIRYYGSDRLQIGHTEDGYGIYNTPEDGLRDAWATLQLPYYHDVRAAIATQDPYKIARAWENSPWAAGHYGSDGRSPGCIALKVMGNTTRKFTTKIKKFAKPRTWYVRSGTYLCGYDPKKSGGPVLSRKIRSTTSATADAEVWINWKGAPPYPIPHGGPFLRVTTGGYKGLLIVEGLVTLDE